MKEKICPIDGRPCDRFCSHRFKNRPEGGCFLTDYASNGKLITKGRCAIHGLGALPELVREVARL